MGGCGLIHLLMRFCLVHFISSKHRISLTHRLESRQAGIGFEFVFCLVVVVVSLFFGGMLNGIVLEF